MCFWHLEDEADLTNGIILPKGKDRKSERETSAVANAFRICVLASPFPSMQQVAN